MSTPAAFSGRARQVQRAALVAAAALVTMSGAAVSTYAMEPEAPAASAHADQATKPARNLKQYNLTKDGIGANGYDVVAYFPEGGGKPQKGLEQFQTEYQGVKYRFASKEHLDTFLASPAKYEPVCGGWCALGIAEGEKFPIDPTSFTIEEGRLNLFYKGLQGDAKAEWIKTPTWKPKRDPNWTKISGEADAASEAKSAVAADASSAAPATLRETLQATKAKFAAAAPKEISETYERGIQDVAKDPAIAKAMKVGDMAPDFELPDAKGGKVSLAQLRSKGPVVLAWYRGAWCPYCNLELQALQQRMGDFTAAGATVVAISPQTPDSSLTTAQKNKLEFPVLSDSGLKVARQYGIAYTLPVEVRKTFAGKLDLAKFNGDAGTDLPVSATYVVAPSGKITYAFVDADYRNRAEPEDVLVAVKAAAGQ